MTIFNRFGLLIAPHKTDSGVTQGSADPSRDRFGRKSLRTVYAGRKCMQAAGRVPNSKARASCEPKQGRLIVQRFLLGVLCTNPRTA
eukprot:309424-Pyramimonas_sp.AAC.2